MDAFHHLVKAILVIVFLYGLAIVMRERGALKEEHSMILARIVTDLCLPAIIFVSLAKQSIQLSQLGPAMAMLAAELMCIALAWMVSKWLGFSKARQGAIVFCSAFGSSTFLGYSIIMEMFPQKPEAIIEAVLISEIGVGYPIFILGPILAAYFGSEASSRKSAWWSSLSFFKSPVFFALVIGLLWSYFKLPGEDNIFLAPAFQVCHVLASALTPVAILSVALIFRLPEMRDMLLALGVVVLIKLLLKPLGLGIFATSIGFPQLWKDVLVLLAAMPPAILGAVFLKRYEGDASMASALLLAASIISVVTILFVFWMIG